MVCTAEIKLQNPPVTEKSPPLIAPPASGRPMVKTKRINPKSRTNSKTVSSMCNPKCPAMMPAKSRRYADAHTFDFDLRQRESGDGDEHQCENCPCNGLQ